MINWNFNPTDYTAINFEPIPEGDYRVRINNVKENNQNTEIVNLQLCIADKDSHTEVELSENAEVNKIPRLYGSGMLVINAPYLLKENTEPVIKYLESILKMES